MTNKKDWNFIIEECGALNNRVRFAIWSKTVMKFERKQTNFYSYVNYRNYSRLVDVIRAPLLLLLRRDWWKLTWTIFNESKILLVTYIVCRKYCIAELFSDHSDKLILIVLYVYFLISIQGEKVLNIFRKGEVVEIKRCSLVSCEGV